MKIADKAARQIKSTASDGAAWRGGDLALLVLVCALYVGARVWRLGATCLWFDEIFGVHAAAWQGWGGMLRFVALDLIHPPLFYGVLKVWAGAGGAGSVWWLRLLPVVTSSLAILPVAWLARELRLGARTLALALLLAAVSGTLVKYAQELRMYGLLLLFAACSLWLFARYCNSAAGARRDAFVLFVANLLLVYTHYFGWLVVALEVVYAAIFVRARLRLLAASAVALAVCFAPWAWAVWRALSSGAGGGFEQNLGWAARPALRELFEPYLALHEPFRARQQSNEPTVLGVDVALALVVFAPPLAALFWRALTRRAGEGDTTDARRAGLDGAPVARRAGDDSDDARRAGADDEDARGVSADGGDARRAGVGDVDSGRGAGRAHAGGGAGRAHVGGGAVVFLSFFAFAPALVAFVLAQVLPQSVWGARHLIVVAPAYLLLAAHALESLRPRWLSVTLKLLLGCWLALACVVAVARRAPVPVWCAWEPLARQAAREEQAGAATDGAARADGAARGAGGPVKIYAFEDLIAYQLWYALRAGGAGNLRVAVVRDAPGVLDDRAFFLPRGFGEVSVETVEAAMREEHFWIALRGAARRGADIPVLKILRARGYEEARRLESAGEGQTAFVVLMRKRRC
ncbi:MAG TPA: hypothetical protein VF538_06535 [Pyrinomonadaceae bacterium]|jgi:hypothetical protein